MQDKCDINYYKAAGIKPTEGVVFLDMNSFIGNKWTNEEMDNLWVENYEKNKPHIVECPEMPTSKPCIFVGSSPAIGAQIGTFREIERKFNIICSNGTYPWAVKHGIRVDYVFVVEAHDHISKDFDHQEDNAILIHSPFVCPEVLDKWQGEKYCYIMGGGERFEKLINEEYDDVNVSGGNVINTSILWAYRYLECRNFILTGMSLCYYDDYYYDNRSTEFLGTDIKQWFGKYQAVDIYGKAVNTTPPLTMYKSWLESFTRSADANFINCTEDGILGVLPEPVKVEGDNIQYRIKYLPWMSIAPLKPTLEAYRRKIK